jgi:hypothetical protein
MRRFLTFLWPGLLLVSCDKPAPSDQRTGDPAPARRAERGGDGRHAPTRIPDTPQTPESLRERLEDAAEIESSEERYRAIAEVAWNAFEIDPELASEAFLKLPEGCPERIRLLQHYAMRLNEQNHDEATAWANALASELECATALSQIALTLAETDPLAAANLISESGMAGHEFDVAVVQIIQRWAAKSPPDAAAWVTGFPPGPAREAGIKYTATRWLHSDAPAVFSWLASLKDAGVRKEAALGLEEAILQQPQEIRDGWLQHADAAIRSELDQLRAKATETVGDNIPHPQS